LSWSGIGRSTAKAMEALIAQPRIRMPMNPTCKRVEVHHFGHDRSGDSRQLEGTSHSRVVAPTQMIRRQVVGDRRDGRLEQGLPSANTALLQLIRVAADELAGNRPQRPVISHDRDHNADLTRITRVRRRPSMRWSTSSHSRTMVAESTKKAYPMDRVQTSPTSHAYAVKPASVWATHERGNGGHRDAGQGSPCHPGCPGMTSSWVGRPAR
jgi:hypothetical protein